MKRYEKMSKEEIIEVLLNRECNKCKADKYCDAIYGSCQLTMKEWLNEEIEIKPRWATIKSNEEWEDIYVEWLKKPSIDVKNFIDWLKEEVEV